MLITNQIKTHGNSTTSVQFTMNSLILLFPFLNFTTAKVSVDTDSAFGEDADTPSKITPHEERINLSVPGTKWCGPGNTAEDYDHLGSYSAEDMCCRAHDHCDAIASHDSMYGLTNDDYFTRLNCKCDKAFHDCLRSINSTFADWLGEFYFDVRSSCYKEQHPIMECAEVQHKLFLARCIKYKVDKSKPKEYQWFDLPFYTDDHTFNDQDFEGINTL